MKEKKNKIAGSPTVIGENAPVTVSADGAGARRKNAASRRILRRLTVTAVCTAFAVVLKCFTNLALNLPGLGIKIGLGGIFNFFPAALCGPLWGGAASALTDLIGHFIAPDGAYIPWLTVTAFMGGCIVGVLWRISTRRTSHTLRVAMFSVFLVLLSFGVCTNGALQRDGVTSGVIAKQAALPTRGELDGMPLSPLSRFVVGLSRYSKDSKNLTLCGVPKGTVAIPAAVSVNGEMRNVTSVASGALEGVGGTLVIPETVKTIADDALGSSGAKPVIIGKSGSGAAAFAKSAGLEFRESDGETAGDVLSVENAAEHETLSIDGFSFGQSDTYRKNLASNINIVVFGSILAGSCGMIFIILNLIVTALPIGKGEDGEERAFSFLKIAICVTVSGLFVTTVNTFILRAFIPAWGDRALLVLLIPRIAEEVVVRLIQAYIISLLWGAVGSGRAGSILKKL